jgi:hypothetical protein
VQIGPFPTIVPEKGVPIFMADRIIVYWRDIPAQVIIKKGRTNAKRELSLRFTEAIDMCAMRTGAADTDDYLAEWRKAEPTPVSDDLEAEADKALAELEAAYDRDRLIALVKAGGRDNG